jgi:hypothetical protein
MAMPEASCPGQPRPSLDPEQSATLRDRLLAELRAWRLVTARTLLVSLPGQLLHENSILSHELLGAAGMAGTIR